MTEVLKSSPEIHLAEMPSLVSQSISEMSVNGRDGLTSEERRKRFMDSPVGQILEITEKYPPLGEDKIEHLIKRYQDHGDLDSKELAVLHNSRFALYLAKQYYGVAPKQNVGLEDLFQMGMIGLQTAVERVNLDTKRQKDAKFVSFASYTIRNVISRYMNENRGSMRLPPGVGYEIGRHQILERTIVMEPGSDRDEEVAKLLPSWPTEPPEVIDERKHEDPFERSYPESRTARVKIEHEAAKEKAVSEVRDLRVVANRIRSAYTSRLPAQIVENIPDSDSEIDPITVAYIKIRRELMENILDEWDSSDPRHPEVLRLRYGFSDGIPLSLDEVGAGFDVTRERIRQLEAKALKDLQEPAAYIQDLADVDNVDHPKIWRETENERWFSAQIKPRSFRTAREYTDEKLRTSHKASKQ